MISAGPLSLSRRSLYGVDSDARFSSFRADLQRGPILTVLPWIHAGRLRYPRGLRVLKVHSDSPKH